MINQEVMKKAYILIALFALICGTQGFAQDSFVGWTYSMAAPMGETADYISAYSPRGIQLEGRYAVDAENRITVGGSFTWNVFYRDMGTESVSVENATVTGQQWRYINAMPMLVTAHYHHNSGGNAVPYLGVGLGTSWIEQSIDMSGFVFEDANWHFTVAPEAGVIVPTNDWVALYLSVKYNYSPAAGSTEINHQWMGINIGVGYF